MVTNIVATKKVTRKNEDGTLQTVERVIFNASGVVASNLNAAIALAAARWGKDNAENLDEEQWSTAEVVAVQVK